MTGAEYERRRAAYYEARRRRKAAVEAYEYHISLRTAQAVTETIQAEVPLKKAYDEATNEMNERNAAIIGERD